MQQRQRPVTERANELTTELDVSSPKDFLHLLQLSDNQIFEGYEGFPSLLDISDKVAAAAEAIGTAMMAAAADETKKKKVRVVMAGAGTSGRIAWVVSKDVNAVLTSKGIDPCCRYLIAGGDLALLTSQESAEDDVVRARGDLEKLLKEDEGSDIQLVYIGITCGLSAPYVASQLDMAMGIPNAVTVLMGFNPVALARTLPIEGWPGVTFSTVAQRLEGRAASDPAHNHILTPVYGPEALSGSTRMKGGSTTKLLLDGLFSLAILRAQGSIPGRPLAAADARSFFEGCRGALTAVYEGSLVSQAVERCGAALRAGGHIYYYGNPGVGTLGVIDASECVPTFGARPDDINAYVTGGWAALGNRDGDLSAHGGAYDLSGERFLTEIVPNVTANDAIVILGSDIFDALSLCKNVRAAMREGHTPAYVRAFAFPSAGDIPCAKVSETWLSVVRVPSPAEGRPLPYTNKQLAVKLALNAISTGAFTAAGKVFRNRMVDLRISNAKLCLRAYDLVASLTGAPLEAAQECVMRAIYGEKKSDEIAALLARPLSDHVKAAYQQEKVVPLALLLASGVKTVVDAREALRAEPVVRTALLHAIKN